MPEIHEIRATTVLPARRNDIELTTADALTLVGEIALPADRPAAATLVCLHPLPTHGGMMDSHILRKASYRLPALADIAVLRFNTRGTTSTRGTSGGTYDEGEGERHDLAAALDYVRRHQLPNPWLLGWSFGTEIALIPAATTGPRTVQSRSARRGGSRRGCPAPVDRRALRTHRPE
jgi:alpha/beta superfamily hydrolase